MSPLAQQGASLLHRSVRSETPLAGGDLSDIICAELDDGSRVVLKNGPLPMIEAQMLGCISDGGAPAPTVLGANDTVLALSWIETSGSLRSGWASLGAALQRLHANTAPRYGWQQNYAFGGLSITNTWHDNWPDFWAQCRLRPHLPALPPEIGRRIEALAQDLPNRLPAKPSSALLHGDLWSGNILMQGQSLAALIDPACYYGDAEVDIAMLQLFDVPGAAFFDAYGSAQPGHDQRLAIYRLWPALVHLRLFGQGYLPLVDQQLKLAGA